MGKDDTVYAKIDGYVKFEVIGKGKNKLVSMQQNKTLVLFFYCYNI